MIIVDRKISLRLLANKLVSLIWSEGALASSMVFDEACKLVLLEDAAYDIVSQSTIDELRDAYRTQMPGRVQALLGSDLRIMQYQLPFIGKFIRQLGWRSFSTEERYTFLNFVFEEATSSRGHSIRSMSYMSTALIDIVKNVLSHTRTRSMVLASREGLPLIASMKDSAARFDVGTISRITDISLFVRKVLLTVDFRSDSFIVDQAKRYDSAFVNFLDAYSILGDDESTAGRLEKIEQVMAECGSVLVSGGLLLCIVPRPIAAQDRFREFREKIEKSYRLVATIVLDDRNLLRDSTSAPLFVVFKKLGQKETVDNTIFSLLRLSDLMKGVCSINDATQEIVRSVVSD